MGDLFWAFSLILQLVETWAEVNHKKTDCIRWGLIFTCGY